ncbi:predicted protein [Sclerotinia sclerotiorum 1980 UF-70]|uniref:Uncharacterized protein n=1 Tax=Sclerotinia sclerotiorum (strain ATCC 18683 / 1980 / Ss-1) TaxID=665079 RepID=A7EEN1_SCLS1|nr:predicted protein [Sclerotinia sclerotiorum 1980 UF-70]EDO01297.1 predicted protein [Sclerotinia sclerotiorum 1980 UF-70]
MQYVPASDWEAESITDLSTSSKKLEGYKSESFISLKIGGQAPFEQSICPLAKGTRKV